MTKDRPGFTFNLFCISSKNLFASIRFLIAISKDFEFAKEAMSSDQKDLDFCNPATGGNTAETLRDMLIHQANTIWPQESAFIQKYNLPSDAKILDLGCGSGEICARLADLFPHAEVHGIDIERENVEISKIRCSAYGSRVILTQGDGAGIAYADNTFDLVVIRSVLQGVQERQQMLIDATRVLCSNGVLHVLGEDYGMMWAAPCDLQAVDRFLHALIRFYDSSGCDGRLSRKLPSMMRQIAAANQATLDIQYVHVDTQRCDPKSIAAIFRGWKAGWMDIVAKGSGHTREEIEPGYDELVSVCENPDGYLCWQLMVASIRKR